MAWIVIGLFSFYLLNRSLTGIPLGSAYAIWTGIGAAGTAVVGMAFYGEPVTVMRLACLAMLVGGIVGLKIFE
jgi:quaternary ammonium compound-resistance protein SugE